VARGLSQEGACPVASLFRQKTVVWRTPDGKGSRRCTRLACGRRKAAAEVGYCGEDLERWNRGTIRKALWDGA
jgi:hypothetical protein